MNFKKWVKSIQTVSYNGERTANDYTARQCKTNRQKLPSYEATCSCAEPKKFRFMSMLNHMFKTDTDHDLILYDACSTL